MTSQTREADSPPAAATETSESRRRWLILLVAAMAQLMVVLDATIVNIALPSAQKDLGFPNTDRQWIVTAYALAFGSLLLLGGKIGDLYGRKAAFITGMAGFALASAVGGAAQSFAVLVTARALQGAFGALLAPAVLSTLATTFTVPKERSKAFGVFGAVAGAGSAVGLLLGGILTETLSWRYCFYVNLVLAAGAIWGAIALLQNEKAEQRPRLDIPGTLLATAGLFCLVYGFSNASTDGWGSARTLIVLATGVALMTAFVLVEQRVSAPLLPLRIVLDRVRGASYLAVGLSSLSIFGVFLFLTYYLQSVKGLSPIQSGVAFLPLAIGIVITSTLANILVLPRTGPRPLIPSGMVLGAVGMLILSRLTPTSGYFPHIFPALVILGLGFGVIIAPAISSATLGATPQDAGVASAMVNTMQQIGGSIGVALLSTLAVSTTASYLRSHRGATDLAQHAQVHGYTTAFLASAAVFLGAAILTRLLLPRGVLANPTPPSRWGEAERQSPERHETGVAMTTRDETSVVPGRMWESAGASVVIDYDSHSLTEYAQKWDLPAGLGEMGLEDTRKVTTAGTVRIAAVPFATGSDSVSDHLKYSAVSSATFSMPESGSIEFSVDVVAAAPGTQSSRVVHGTYTDTPNGGRPYAAPALEGQQAALAFTVSNLETGQEFAWLVSGTSVHALIERLPSSVHAPSATPGDPRYVDLTAAHTQIVRSAAIAPGKKNGFSLLYRRNSQQSTIDFFLNEELFARVDHVGIPLDTQGVPYSGVYPSYRGAPGREVKDQMNTFRIGHGLRTLLDAFPFQDADAPEQAVSVPLGERLFGQGARGEFSKFQVTTI